MVSNENGKTKIQYEKCTKAEIDVVVKEKIKEMESKYDKSYI